MLSIVSELMQPQVYLDWKQAVLLQTTYSLGTTLAVMVWIFVPKLVSLASICRLMPRWQLQGDRLNCVTLAQKTQTHKNKKTKKGYMETSVEPELSGIKGGAM